jgi:toxin HigB-1
MSLASCHLTGYNKMIKSFKSKRLKRYFEADDASGLASSSVEKIKDVLSALDTASKATEVGLFPGWRLHPLKGSLNGWWSVTVTGNWRIIFRFQDGHVFDVDLVDYH